MVKLAEPPGTSQALALYTNPAPPRKAEVQRRLARSGVLFHALPPNPSTEWSFVVEHPEWGSACIAGIAHAPEFSPASIDFARRLFEEEKAHARGARSAIGIVASERPGHAVQDRKLLFRFLHALLDPSTPHATGYDRSASKLWSADALGEELAHDADLDLDALLHVHGTGDAPPRGEPRPDGFLFARLRVDWLHTHGLADIGSYDFEILRPSPQLLEAGFELVRGLAHRLLHGTIDPHTLRQTLFVPGGDVALLDVTRFDAEGPSEERALRVRLPHGDLHDGPRRVVVCDPLVAADVRIQRTKIWPVRASRALRRIPAASAVIDFPPQVTALLAERAQKTALALRAIVEELAEADLHPVMQVFCPKELSDPNGPCEILHFKLLGFTDDETFEGELLHDPQSSTAYARGQRATFGVEDLANWQVATPVGPITPYDRTVARMLRQLLPELRAEMAAKDARRR